MAVGQQENFRKRVNDSMRNPLDDCDEVSITMCYFVNRPQNIVCAGKGLSHH